MSATTTTDAAYLAIIDDLEVRLGASRGWWKRLRVAEARITALEAAGDALYTQARHADDCALKHGSWCTCALGEWMRVREGV